MILILKSGISMQGTVDEIIEYLQKTANAIYPSSTGTFELNGTTYSEDYSHIDTSTIGNTKKIWGNNDLL